MSGKLLLGAALVAAVGLTGCATCCLKHKECAVTTAAFGKTKDGVAVNIHTLKNQSGMEVRVMDYGATIVSIRVPDQKGQLGDVALGFDNLSDYETKSPYFGCLVGRYGNRIAKGKFALDGKQYTLATNNAPNSLHGGIKGFDKAVWQAQCSKTAAGPAIVFTHVSPDGEEGFPGKLTMQVTYTLTDKNELVLDYTATTDKDTVVNLTNHSYFNLEGQGTCDILGHELLIAGGNFTPVDVSLIPTGELRPVKGTPFDFTASTAIGARIAQADEQLKFGGGYDHNWVLDREGAGLSFCARVIAPTSGRVMEVSTTEPGVQFYCGNFLDGTLTGKEGKVYKHRYGLCLETQHYPDSPNHANFPPVTLKPGQTYKTTTVYKFSTK